MQVEVKEQNQKKRDERLRNYYRNLQKKEAKK